MSYSLNANIWLGYYRVAGFKTISQIFNFIAKVNPSVETLSGKVLANYEKKHETIQFKLNDFNTSKMLGKYLDEGNSIIIETIFPLYLYKHETSEIVRSAAPLSIRFYHKQHSDHNRLGDIEISIDNVGNFTTPRKVLEIQKEDETFNHINKKLQMLSGFEKNYDDFINFIKKIIEKTNPEHVLVGTADTEINPLTSHTIYHKNINNFVIDLLKITKMHEKGGFYFDDFDHIENFGYPARKLTKDYGYLRKQSYKHNERFLKNLEDLTDFVLENQKQLKLPEDEILHCLFELSDIEVEVVLEGYLISAREKTRTYIESPFFCIYKKIKEKLI